MCFDALGDEGEAYFTFAVETTALLSSKMKEAPSVEKLASVEGDKMCAHIGCGALGSKILLLGGMKHTQGGDASFRRYSFDDLNDGFSRLIHKTPPHALLCSIYSEVI
ncbi:Uncharacterized protein TCM_041690 [Theobroma cacao]|uniref:Uncharacterized protein n=1 Tax=Theobroma cacao TaxID=3641 RepID=A0A061GWN0_THECC|nr:Uncharacterized protein TCM_041690 [Theobroma cacao]